MTVPRLQGLLESSLYVADLQRSVNFYQELFGFELIHSENDRLRALSVSGKQVLLLFRLGGSRSATETPNGAIPPHDGCGTLHLAFAVDAADLEKWRERLREHNVPIESEVRCGGTSLYFRDPDDHLVELITPGCWPIY